MKIHYPAGIHYVSELMLEDNMEIYGDGPQTILMLPSGSNQTIIKGVGRNNFYIHDLQLDGNWQKQITGPGINFQLFDCSDFTIERVESVGSYNDSIWTNRCRRFRISACYVHHNGVDCISMHAVSDCIIENNHCHDSGLRSSGAGILVLNEEGGPLMSERVTVANNFIRNCHGQLGNPIVCQGVSDLSVTGNKCEAGAANGITVRGVDRKTRCQTATIIGNQIKHSAMGIDVRFCDQLTVSANVTELNFGDGIYIDDSNRYAISGNISRSNQGRGIIVTGVGDLASAQGSISGNTLIANSVGILLSDQGDGSIRGVSVNGNTCAHNGEDQIRLENCQKCVVNGNIGAVRETGTSAYNIIANNLVYP